MSCRISRSEAEQYAEALNELGAEDAATVFEALLNGDSVRLRDTWVDVNKVVNRSDALKWPSKIRWHTPDNDSKAHIRVVGANATRRHERVFHEYNPRGCENYRMGEPSTYIQPDSMVVVQVRTDDPEEAQKKYSAEIELSERTDGGGLTAYFRK